jgi:hypothetical protein
MAKPKQQRKKRPAKKKGQGSRLPKSVEALLSYLGGPGPTAPTIQQTPPQRGFMIDQAPKSFVTSVAEAVVARQASEKAKRLVGAEPLKKSLVSTFMPQQPQPQTIVVQQSAPAQSSEKQTEDIRKTIMKETSGIESRLTEQLRLQGANQLFKTMREQKGASFGSLPSQEPSYFGRTPSGIASVVESEDVGSVTSAGQLPTITAEALAQYQQQQYGQSIASAKLPAGKVLKGKAPKMTEVAGGGEAAAPKKRGPKPKVAAPVQQPQTFSQSLGGLSAVARAQLPSPSVSSSVVSSSSTGSKSRAREIYQEATSRGLSQSDIVSAMASGGGGAAQQEPQLGKTLGELQKKPKRRFKIVTGMEV